MSFCLPTIFLHGKILLILFCLLKEVFPVLLAKFVTPYFPNNLYLLH